MFITWRTYTATAGFSTQLDYSCALCGARAVASVQTQATGTSTAVYGAGGGGDQATMSAQYAAQANAIGALHHAPCPRCGGYQPVVTSRFEAYNERFAKRKKRALPIAAIAFGAVMMLGIVPAVRDLKHSSALLVMFVFGALAVAGIVYAVLRSAGPRPTVPWGQVHFWWGRPDGTSGWVPPPHVPPPALAPPSSANVAGGVLAGFAGVAMLVSLAVWGSTFEKIYVVDWNDRPVTVDGVDVTADAETYGIEDKHVRKFGTRSGQAHEVVVAGVKYTLPEASHGWVVAPDAKENDVCFAEYEMVYGASSKYEPKWGALEPNQYGVLVLAKTYDDAFKDSPKTQQVEAGKTVTRWSLRTVSCESIEEEKDAKKGSHSL